MEGWIISGICLLLILGTTIRGYKRGFLRSAFSMVALIVSIVLVGIVAPYVQGFLDATPMRRTIYNSVSRNMENSMNEFVQGIIGEEEEETSAQGDGTGDVNESTESGIGGIQGSDMNQTQGNNSIYSGDTALTEDEQMQWLDICNIPKWIQEKVIQDNEQSMDTLRENVSQYIADLLINLIAYVITFLLIFILIQTISIFLGIVNYIPILGGLNRKLGIVLGLLQGLLILWILCLILTIFTPTAWGSQLISIIEGNPILAVVYHFMINIGTIE